VTHPAQTTPEAPVPTQSQENSAKPSSMKEVKPLSFIFEIDNALSREICGEMIRRFEAKAEQQYPSSNPSSTPPICASAAGRTGRTSTPPWCNP
jgi:hypothetical protein